MSDYIKTTCWVNEWMNAPGTYPSHKPPGKIHSRLTWGQWVQQTQTLREATQMPLPTVQPLNPTWHTLGCMFIAKCAGAGSPESRARVQLCSHHWLTLTSSSAVCPSLLSRRTGRWGGVCPRPSWSATLTAMILWGCQPDPAIRKGPDNFSRAEHGVGTVQCEAYLSFSLRVLLDQARNKGNATLWDGPVEEILGQRR